MSEAISEKLPLEIPAQDGQVHTEDSGNSHQQRNSDLCPVVQLAKLTLLLLPTPAPLGKIAPPA